MGQITHRVHRALTLGREWGFLIGDADGEPAAELGARVDAARGRVVLPAREVERGRRADDAYVPGVRMTTRSGAAAAERSGGGAPKQMCRRKGGAKHFGEKRVRTKRGKKQQSGARGTQRIRDGHGRRRSREDLARTEGERDERAVVVRADAAAHPRAVVVVPRHAPPAREAVLRAQRARAHRAAFVAEFARGDRLGVTVGDADGGADGRTRVIAAACEARRRARRAHAPARHAPVSASTPPY